MDSWDEPLCLPSFKMASEALNLISPEVAPLLRSGAGVKRYQQYGHRVFCDLYWGSECECGGLHDIPSLEMSISKMCGNAT
jgi:hypothetical protein